MSDLQVILKQAAMQIGAGGSAGFVEVCIMHPLDLIKTRLQLQTSKVGSRADPNYYYGVVDCMKKMYKHEGLFSFWKGILPPILAETPKRAVKFFCFEQYKKMFMFGSPVATPLVRSLKIQCYKFIRKIINIMIAWNYFHTWPVGFSTDNCYFK